LQALDLMQAAYNEGIAEVIAALERKYPDAARRQVTRATAPLRQVQEYLDGKVKDFWLFDPNGFYLPQDHAMDIVSIPSGLTIRLEGMPLHAYTREFLATHMLPPSMAGNNLPRYTTLWPQSGSK
jgi:hypothetical protein